MLTAHSGMPSHLGFAGELSSLDRPHPMLRSNNTENKNVSDANNIKIRNELLRSDVNEETFLSRQLLSAAKINTDYKSDENFCSSEHKSEDEQTRESLVGIERNLAVISVSHRENERSDGGSSKNDSSYLTEESFSKNCVLPNKFELIDKRGSQAKGSLVEGSDYLHKHYSGQFVNENMITPSLPKDPNIHNKAYQQQPSIFSRNSLINPSGISPGLLQQQLYIHQKLGQNVNEQSLTAHVDCCVNEKEGKYNPDTFIGIENNSNNKSPHLRGTLNKNLLDAHTPPPDVVSYEAIRSLNPWNTSHQSEISPAINNSLDGPITVNYTKATRRDSIGEDSNNRVVMQFICSNTSSPHIGSPNNTSMASITSGDTSGTTNNFSHQHHPGNMSAKNNKPRMYSAIMGSMENSFVSPVPDSLTNNKNFVPQRLGPFHPHRHHDNVPLLYIPPQPHNIQSGGDEETKETTPTQDNTTATDLAKAGNNGNLKKKGDAEFKNRKKKKASVHMRDDSKAGSEKAWTKKVNHGRQKTKRGVNELFRPSSDACTPRFKKDIIYKPAPERDHKAMSNTMGTISRPNFRDALRRVAMIIRQHIVKIERRFQNKALKQDLFRKSMSNLFQEDNFLTPLHKCTMVRVPMARPGAFFTMKKINTKHIIPTETEIYNFAHQLFKAVQLSSECSIVCLIYIERLMETAKVPLLASTWRPIFMCGLLLASKVWQDLSSWNIEFATVYPQYSLDSINKLEVLFLKQIKWDLYISSSSYAKYYFALRALLEKKDFRRRYNELVGGVGVSASEAMKIQKRTEMVKEEALLQLSRSV